MTSPIHPQSSVFGSEIRCSCKAIYYPNPITGDMRLARIQAFNRPVYNPATATAEKVKNRRFRFASDDDPDEVFHNDKEDDKIPDAANVARAVRRARRNAFDLIMCNPDLDAFVTFTYSPDVVDDKASYDECYQYLRGWLSNGVQRRGLKYVCVPELTKRGDIHFHALCNADALRWARARHARTGRALSHHGDPVYNLTDWNAGFSTAQLIRKRGDGDDERAAVAKYIFKYMGKNFGAKVGGRYMLHGGALAQPLTEYGHCPEQFVQDLSAASVYSKEIGDDGKIYTEYDFLHGCVRGEGVSCVSV